MIKWVCPSSSLYAALLSAALGPRLLVALGAAKRVYLAIFLVERSLKCHHSPCRFVARSLRTGLWEHCGLVCLYLSH